VNDVIVASKWLSTAHQAVFVVNAVSASSSRAQLSTTVDKSIAGMRTLVRRCQVYEGKKMFKEPQGA
jgi:menaquinone-dependent protoporphyrinogen IX oxidase